MIGLLWGAAAIGGGIIGAALACVPGLHLFFILSLGCPFVAYVDHTSGIALLTGIIAGYAMTNSVSATLAAAPDESYSFAGSAMDRLRHNGQAGSAIFESSTGGLLATALLTVTLLCFGPTLLPSLLQTIARHQRWLAWGVTAFAAIACLTSPTMGGPHTGRWENCRRGFAALMLFCLTGFVGVILWLSAPLSLLAVGKSLAVGLLGLFTLPTLLLRSPDVRPEQKGTPTTLRQCWTAVISGMWAGALCVAAPGATAAATSMLCAHTRQPSSQALIVAHGAARLTFYGTCLALVLLPGGGLVFPEAATLLERPFGPQNVTVSLAAFAIAVGTAFLCQHTLLQVAQRLYQRLSLNTHRVALWIVLLVTLFGGTAGVALLLVTTGLGLLIHLYTKDSAAGMGLVLAPLLCESSALGPWAAVAMGVR
jgi:TctA family transporter